MQVLAGTAEANKFREIITTVLQTDVVIGRDPRKFKYDKAEDFATFDITAEYPAKKIRKANAPYVSIYVIDDNENKTVISELVIKNVKDNTALKALRATLSKSYSVTTKRKPKFYIDCNLEASMSKTALALQRCLQAIKRYFDIEHDVLAKDKIHAPLRSTKPPKTDAPRAEPKTVVPKFIEPGVLVEFDIDQSARSGHAIGVVLERTGGGKHWACKIIEYTPTRGQSQVGMIWRFPDRLLKIYDKPLSNRLQSERERALESGLAERADRLDARIERRKNKLDKIEELRGNKFHVGDLVKYNQGGWPTVVRITKVFDDGRLELSNPKADLFQSFGDPRRTKNRIIVDKTRVWPLTPKEREQYQFI
jgi:hypothetical protein